MPLTTAEIDRVETTETWEHQPCDACGSSDALTYYERKLDDMVLGYTHHCFSCGDNKNDVQLVDYLEENGDYEPLNLSSTGQYKNSKGHVPTETPGGFNFLARWGLTLEAVKKYGVTSNKAGVYFPYYDDNKQLCGYKIRKAPLDSKETSWSGAPGKGLFGHQVANVRSDKETYAVICEGEPDAVAGYLMMRNSNYSFLSASSGAQSMVNAMVKNAQLLSQFSRVIYITDNDEAGREAAAKVAAKFPDYLPVVLPNKYNDIAEMNLANDDATFRDLIYGAKSRVLNCFVTEEEMVAAILQGRGEALGTGLPKLDDALGGGLFPHELSVLMADPGKGKSTASRWLAYAVGISASTKPVYMPFEESYRLAGEKLSRLHNNGVKLDKEDAESVAATTRLMLKHVNIVKSETLNHKTPGDFVKWVEAVVVESGTSYVCIDHISQVAQSMPGEERLNIQGIMNGLVEVVKKLPVHITVVTHNKRDGVTYDEEGNEVERKPHIRDGYGSGSLERDAFVVLALWGRDSNTKISILKNRNGDVVDRDIHIKYLPGGLYSDGTVKVTNNKECNVTESKAPNDERLPDGQPVRSGCMDTKPGVDKDCTETEAVQHPEASEAELHTGLQNTEGCDGRDERLPENRWGSSFSRNVELLREGLYRECAYSFPTRLHKVSTEQHDVRPMGREAQPGMGVGCDDTTGVVGSGAVCAQTDIVPRRDGGTDDGANNQASKKDFLSRFNKRNSKLSLPFGAKSSNKTEVPSR